MISILEKNAFFSGCKQNSKSSAAQQNICSACAKHPATSLGTMRIEDSHAQVNHRFTLYMVFNMSEDRQESFEKGRKKKYRRVYRRGLKWGEKKR